MNCVYCKSYCLSMLLCSVLLPSWKERAVCGMRLEVWNSVTELELLESGDVPVVEFVYFVVIRMPGESYRRPFMSRLMRSSSVECYETPLFVDSTTNFI